MMRTGRRDRGNLWRWRVPGRCAAGVRVCMPVSQDAEQGWISWAQSSRSAASAWPRRSTANCCGRRAFSAGTRSSDTRLGARSVSDKPRAAWAADGWRRLDHRRRGPSSRRRLVGRPRGRRDRLRPGIQRERLHAAVPAAVPDVVPGPDARPRARARPRAPALVVANHSGVLPFDALMLQAGVFDEHPAHRNLRVLSADLVYEVPVLSDLARRSGHIRADPDAGRPGAGGRRARRRVPRGLQGDRQAVQRAVPAAAVRPGRVRRDRPAGGRADHPVRDRRAPRRSTR